MNAQLKSRTEQVLDAVRAGSPGPTNYVGILDRIGGSKQDLDPVLTGLVNGGILLRSSDGYRLKVPAERAPEEVSAPAGVVTPLRQGHKRAQRANRPTPAAPAPTKPLQSRSFHLAPRLEIKAEYISVAALVQITVGDTYLELDAKEMTALFAWWHEQRAAGAE